MARPDPSVKYRGLAGCRRRGPRPDSDSAAKPMVAAIQTVPHNTIAEKQVRTGRFMTTSSRHCETRYASLSADTASIIPKSRWHGNGSYSCGNFNATHRVQTPQTGQA
jgi:hypothetical protein